MKTTATPATSFEPARMSRWARLRGAAGHFFTGAGLPVFLGVATVLYEAFLLAVVLAPPGWGGFGAFAEEFKIWCFSYDPRTGGMEWMAVVIMLAEPVFIFGLVLFLWRFGRLPVAKARPGGWHRHWRAALAGLAFGATAVGGLFAYGRPSGTEPPVPPFPGERIRTTLTPPDFSLHDHRGAPVATGDLRGGVTLVTGVYAFCSTTCPEILLQVRDLLDTLPPAARARLTVCALSLNPEYDTAELMGGIAEGYGLEYPDFRYLNGDPVAVREVLRDFQFAARRNPDTGAIDHANLFILLDAEGRIAYRFNLDRRHRGWLREAVVALAAEAGAAAGRP